LRNFIEVQQFRAGFEIEFGTAAMSARDTACNLSCQIVHRFQLPAKRGLVQIGEILWLRSVVRLLHNLAVLSLKREGFPLHAPKEKLRQARENLSGSVRRGYETRFRSVRGTPKLSLTLPKFLGLRVASLRSIRRHEETIPMKPTSQRYKGWSVYLVGKNSTQGGDR